MKSNCPRCLENVEYFILSTDKTIQRSTKKFGELTIEWCEISAYCKSCKAELYVSDIEKINNKNFQLKVKEAQRKNVGFDYSDL